MIIVIFCGGSGTRLWPLSTHQNPKQLLNIVGDESPLQVSYNRAKQITDKVYLLPERRLIDGIRQQLPDLDDEHIINEPGLRGTANCLLAAIDALTRKGMAGEPIAFIHADHHIRDLEGFITTLKRAAEVSAARRCIALVGPEPTYPATIFGYIHKSERIEGTEIAYTVSEFKEKPDFETAKRFVSSGEYLWNCGYFVASVDVFLETIERDAPELHANYKTLSAIAETSSEEYKQAYLSLANDAIDYALMEKTNNLAVLPAAFDWADIGSFRDAHEISEQDEHGNHFRGEGIHDIEVQNSYVRNEESKPIAVIGLDNVVIVNTTNGLLVARKDLSHRVGEIAKQVQANDTAA